MKIGLFIPCYIDQFYPDVGLATVELLEQAGCTVEYPDAQACCGQPMANTGCWEEARPLAESFLKTYAPYEYVVCPSGSCTAMVTHHYDHFLEGQPGFTELKAKTFDLVQFLTDVVKLDKLNVKFPHRVGLHNSCHGLRELGLGRPSERMEPDFNKARQLLQLVEGLTFVNLQRNDECCGFGGTFAIGEEAVSCMMGNDRIHDHEQAGAEVMVAGDMSCLMHMQGLISRQKKPLKTMHIAQILAGRPLPQ